MGRLHNGGAHTGRLGGFRFSFDRRHRRGGINIEFLEIEYRHLLFPAVFGQCEIVFLQVFNHFAALVLYAYVYDYERGVRHERHGRLLGQCWTITEHHKKCESGYQCALQLYVCSFVAVPVCAVTGPGNRKDVKDDLSRYIVTMSSGSWSVTKATIRSMSSAGCYESSQMENLCPLNKVTVLFRTRHFPHKETTTNDS